MVEIPTLPLIRFFNSIQPSSVSWLVKPYIPMGKVTVIQGDPGDGKTTLALAIAAMLSVGKAMPGTVGEPLTGNTIYQSAEDNAADTLMPRLMGMGADCAKIAFIDTPIFDIGKDCDMLEASIREIGALMLVLDPLQAYIGRGADMCRAADMRRLMSGLAIAAERTNCAVVAIGHMNKSTGAKSLYRGLGSIDIAASARSVLLVGRSAEDENVRVMSHVKSSLAQEGAPIAFTIGDNSVVNFIGEFDGEILLPEDSFPIPEDNKRELAAEIILRLLSDEAKPCAEVYDACLAADIKSRTVDKAKKDLAVRSVRKPEGWYWTLQ
jgi:RecA-family ATPase